MSPPIERPDRLEESPRDGGEHDTLWLMLDYYRDTLLVKCAGLSDEELARRAVPPSNLSLLGLLRHMSDVELSWFDRMWAGNPVVFNFDPDQTDADFDDAAARPGNEVAQVFAASVQRANELARSADVSTLSKGTSRSGDGISLRWILVHLIEEYARHCGHADLLREVIDGETGD